MIGGQFDTWRHQILYRLHLVLKMDKKAEISHIASNCGPIPGSQRKIGIRGHLPSSNIKILPKNREQLPPELGTLEWWISGLMLNPLSLLISRLC